MTYRKQNLTRGTVGQNSQSSNVSGFFNMGPVDMIASVLGTSGLVPMSGGQVRTWVPGMSVALQDTNTYTINTHTVGPASWFGVYNNLARLDETMGTIYYISLQDIPLPFANYPQNVQDMSLGSNSIYVLTQYAIAQVDTTPFQWGVLSYIGAGSISLDTFSSNATVHYDSVNNQVVLWQGTNALWSYDIGLSNTPSGPHTIDTSGVTSFTALQPYIRAKLVNGFLYVGAIDSSNHLWILKINTSTFATTAVLNTGNTITNGAPFPYNFAYSSANNSLFVSTTSGITKINLGTFTVTQTLATLTTGGWIAVDDTHSLLAVSDSAGTSVHSVTAINTTMVNGNTISTPIFTAPGYFRAPSVGQCIYTTNVGSFYIVDTNNDVMYECNVSGSNISSISNYYGFGTSFTWQPANQLNWKGANINATYTIQYNESISLCDTSGGAFTITLPSSSQLGPNNFWQGNINFPGTGQYYIIADGNSTGSFGTHSLTVSGNGHNIWYNGSAAATLTLSTAGEVVLFFWTGSVWVATTYGAGGGGGFTAGGDLTGTSTSQTVSSVSGGSHNGGTGVVQWNNASVAPTSAPTGGSIIYESSGTLKSYGSGSAQVDIAPPGTGTVNSQAGIVTRIVAFIETTGTGTAVAYTYSFPTSNSVAIFKVTWTAKVTTGTSTYLNSTAGETWAAWVTVAGTPHVMGNSSGGNAQKSNFLTTFPAGNPQFDILSLGVLGTPIGNNITTAIVITNTGSQIQIQVTPPISTSATVDWTLDIYIQSN